MNTIHRATSVWAASVAWRWINKIEWTGCRRAAGTSPSRSGLANAAAPRRGGKGEPGNLPKIAGKACGGLHSSEFLQRRRQDEEHRRQEQLPQCAERAHGLLQLRLGRLQAARVKQRFMVPLCIAPGIQDSRQRPQKQQVRPPLLQLCRRWNKVICWMATRSMLLRGSRDLHYGPQCEKKLRQAQQRDHQRRWCASGLGRMRGRDSACAAGREDAAKSWRTASALRKRNLLLIQKNFWTLIAAARTPGFSCRRQVSWGC